LADDTTTGCAFNAGKDACNEAKQKLAAMAPLITDPVNNNALRSCKDSNNNSLIQREGSRKALD
jgi:hypothetical protein